MSSNPSIERTPYGMLRMPSSNTRSSNISSMAVRSAVPPSITSRYDRLASSPRVLSRVEFTAL